MKYYYLRLKREIFKVEGSKIKEDDRLYYVNLRKNNLFAVNCKNYQLINEEPYLLVDIRSGIFVFSAKSKKALFEIYQQQKEKYENFLNQNERLMIKLENELKELIKGE